MPAVVVVFCRLTTGLTVSEVLFDEQASDSWWWPDDDDENNEEWAEENVSVLLLVLLMLLTVSHCWCQCQFWPSVWSRECVSSSERQRRLLLGRLTRCSSESVVSVSELWSVWSRRSSSRLKARLPAVTVDATAVVKSPTPPPLLLPAAEAELTCHRFLQLKNLVEKAEVSRRARLCRSEEKDNVWLNTCWEDGEGEGPQWSADWWCLSAIDSLQFDRSSAIWGLENIPLKLKCDFAMVGLSATLLLVVLVVLVVLSAVRQFSVSLPPPPPPTSIDVLRWCSPSTEGTLCGFLLSLGCSLCWLPPPLVPNDAVIADSSPSLSLDLHDLTTTLGELGATRDSINVCPRRIPSAAGADSADSADAGSGLWHFWSAICCNRFRRAVEPSFSPRLCVSIIAKW